MFGEGRRISRTGQTPFAWYHPGHGERWTFAIHPAEKLSDVVDLPNLMVSLIAWSLAFGSLYW